MASSIFATQLQPFEENQSPSPIEERAVNPFDALRPARSRAPQRTGNGNGNGNGTGNGPPSPINTTNTLHRTLSGDPDVPPPAWKRRPSVTSRTSSSNESRSLVQPGAPLGPGVRPYRSPSESSSHRGPPPSRRHPSLTMTSSVRMPLPPQMFLHESPNGSSTSLADDLPLPQPPFRRRTANGNSSNRSSIVSTSDMSGMTSEDLWQLDGEAVPDMSNPERKAAERPLDTVRRISKQSEQSWQTGLPFDVIWPAAPPPADEFGAALKSKSYNNVSSLSRKPSSILGRKRTVRQGSVDAAPQQGKSPYQQAKSDPSSPVALKADSTLLSSAHSSSTSLSSHPLTMNKSLASLNGRPPSAYYSRDFLSSLAPREGGYAVAAAMGNGLGFVGTNAAEERRRSSVYDGGHRSLSRAPVSKSAGMGRWSLDGGENFHPRGYGSSSPSVTSNLSGHYSSPDPSPPAEEIHIAPLPAGASPAASPSASPVSSPSVIPQSFPQTRPDADVPSLQPPSTLPINPSPLGRSVTDTRSPPPNSIPIPPIPAAVAHPTLSPKKSKKEMKEAKAAEKAETTRVAREKAESARQAAIKRQQQREAAAKEKDEAKRKEKEDKERRKAEKKAKSSKTSAPTSAPPPAPSRRLSSNFGRPSVPTGASGPVHANPNLAPTHRATQSQTMLSTVPPAETRTPRLSMPLGSQAALPPPTSAPVRDEQQSKPRNKLGFLGTIKKRLSVMEPLKPQSGSEASVPVQRQAAAPLPIQSAVQNPMFAPSAPQHGPGPATPPRQNPAIAPHAAVAITANSSVPAPVPSPGLPPRSSSFQHTSTAPPPILTKSISHETPNRGNSPNSLQRSRSSLVGPRPMRPSSGTHRPASVVSQQSANGVDASPASASFAQASPSSFPFSTATSTSNSAALMTPSTLESPGVGHHAQPPLSASSGLSQVNSHLSTSTHSNDRLSNSDVASPFESSRKSSMTSDGSKPLGFEGAEGSYKRESAVLDDDGDGDDDLLSPERESSKSSNETIHPSEAVSFVAAH